MTSQSENTNFSVAITNPSMLNVWLIILLQLFVIWHALFLAVTQQAEAVAQTPCAVCCGSALTKSRQTAGVLSQAI